MKRSPRRERGSNIEPIELLLDRPRPAPVERRCCCTPRSLANAVRCFHCLARRGMQQFRRTRSAPPTPRDEEGGVISPLILASPPRRKRRSPSEARTVSTCATPANTPYGAPAPAGAFPSPPRPTGAKISPSVQPGSVAARLKAMQSAKPAPPPPRPPSAAAERLRARRAAPACGRCGLDVHVADRVVHRDTAYHAQCLRCGACRRSVVDLAWGTLDGDDVLLCDDRARSCLVKARTASLAHAKADKDERPSATDVAGMREARLRAVELVGDELEQLALTGIAPTCALCGGRFAPSDRIVMQGMVKMHEACMTGSKPAQCNGPRLPPARALKDALATLVIKVSLGKGVATFYVARVEQDDETCVAYRPDPAARAPPKRRVDIDALAGATVRALSLQGAEVAPATTLDGEIAPFRWTAQGLDWHFDVRFAIDSTKSVVAVDGATLTVTIN
ncbi:unnamed protein product [Pelagomonas calceolata]|uniref:LIM zinc-binding domain-containing protein n=1 Tax=Pelagomonas calceolata TaxID=35677 RepID=A0A8J2X044_9STRA|nr:unnamed protein product [Pelagomonas calceolata]